MAAISISYLYRDPDCLAERLPTIRLLARSRDDIAVMAGELAPLVAKAVGDAFTVEVVELSSQIGSGALPLETLASAGLAICPRQKNGVGRALTALASALRALPIPVIGRIEDDAVVLDLRCLEAREPFIENLAKIVS